jgi:hypothetical protein
MRLLSGSGLGARSIPWDCSSEVELPQPDGSHPWPAAACFAISPEASMETLAKIQPSASEPPPPAAAAVPEPLLPAELHY